MRRRADYLTEFERLDYAAWNPEKDKHHRRKVFDKKICRAS